jgi:hypothetical protein
MPLGRLLASGEEICDMSFVVLLQVSQKAIFGSTKRWIFDRNGFRAMLFRQADI